MARETGLPKAIREGLEAVAIPLLATVLGLVVGTIFILVAGKDPILAYQAFARAVAGSPRGFGETLVSTIPLIFTGLAVSLAFRSGLFNIGVEGQYLVAQIATVVVGYTVSAPGYIHPALAILAGALAGALWATIAGLLKAYRGVHEVINSIMLNYVGLYLCNYLLNAYLRAGSGQASTHPVAKTAELAQGLIEGSRLHTGLYIALLAALVVWVILWKTPAGYEIRAVGLSPGAAEYAGISVARNIVLAMALSGALAGMAGAVQTLGVNRRFFETTAFVGYGFDGIAVALVGRTHPVGVVLAALLFGALDRGGPLMQATAGVPKAVIWIVQGTVIFFVAAEGIWRFLRNRKLKKEVQTA
ncbi:MAG: ABC transporter permease [Bacillota bacterium]